MPLDINMADKSLLKKEKDGETKEEAASKDMELLEIPPAPDGGWGWVILCACFCLQTFIPGLFTLSGVLLPELVDYFGSSRGETAIIGSMLSACLNISGPFISVLIGFFGCRFVAMLGSLFITSGLLLSTLAPNFYVLILTFGMISGIGLGMIYMSFVVMIAYWFDKKRSVVMGIATSGAGIGVMYMGSLAGWLLQYYDWKNTLCFMACLTAQGIVCGALLRPVTYYNVKEIKASNETIETCMGENHKNKYGKIYNNSCRNDSTMSLDAVILKKKPISNSNQDCHQKQYSYQYCSTKLCDSPATVQRRQLLLKNSTFFSHQDISQNAQTNFKQIHISPINPLLKKDIFYSGSICNISQRPIDPSNISQRPIDHVAATSTDERSNRIDSNKSDHNLQDYDSTITVTDTSRCGLCTLEYIAPMKKMLGFSILTKMPFIIILVANSCFQTAYVIFICFITDYGISIGLEPKIAALATSVFGVGTTVGRIVGGSLTLIPQLEPVIITSVSLCLAGMSSFSIAIFCNGFISLSILSGLTAFFLSPITPLTSEMQVQYLGLDNLTNAQGMINVGKGIGSLLGAPLAGMLQDYSSSPTPPFYLAGSISVIGGLVQSLLLCYSKTPG